jgi:[acyl-carrier-protein] S-malonyltransferase/trans-AT polyketide synthase/acyltransferase/oxidoreductase domain-containing protein
MDKKMDAAVFPGQGSQRPGMGRDFYEAVAESRQAFEEASDRLGYDVAALCFSDDERLNLTEYTQPCIVTTEIAMLRALTARWDFRPSFFGGHSVGEFAALVAAGALPLGATVQIVRERGRLMQGAVPVGVAAMTAVIADEIEVELLGEILADLQVDVGNVNSPRQVVLSGEAGAVAEAERRLQAAWADRPSLRFVRLNVSAPFHSRMLAPIQRDFAAVLAELAGDLDPAAAARVTSNYRGGFHEGGREEILTALVRQISNSVQWRQNMAALASRADAIWEIGPGRPLKAFFQTLGVPCTAITTLATAQRAFETADPTVAVTTSL